ncbi:MAG: PRC-barrel domain-containing protein [bacterium]|nr:PRC-barrel domain-containing protein [bacterium]
MQVKANSLKGRNIIAKQVGKEVSKVEDILYNSTENIVDALLISSGGLFSSTAQVLKLHDVTAFGDDAVMIESISVIREVSGDSIKQFKAKDILVGKKIVTEEGSQLGTITDFFFNSDSGKVEKFEISEGMIQDLKGGRKEIDASGISTIGEDTILVNQSVKQEVKAQPETGGATALFNKAKAKTQETYTQVKEKVDEKKQELDQRETTQQLGPTIGMNDMSRYATPMNSAAYPPVRGASSDTSAVRQNIDEMTQQASDAAERIKHEAQIMKDYVTGTAEELKGKLED